MLLYEHCCVIIMAFLMEDLGAERSNISLSCTAVHVGDNVTLAWQMQQPLFGEFMVDFIGNNETRIRMFDIIDGIKPAVRRVTYNGTFLPSHVGQFSFVLYNVTTNDNGVFTCWSYTRLLIPNCGGQLIVNDTCLSKHHVYLNRITKSEVPIQEGPTELKAVPVFPAITVCFLLTIIAIAIQHKRIKNIYSRWPLVRNLPCNRNMSEHDINLEMRVCDIKS